MPTVDAKVISIADLAVQLSGDTASAFSDLTAALAAASLSTQVAGLALHCDPGSVPVPARHPDRVVQHVSYWSESDASIVATRLGHTARVTNGSALLDPGAGGVRGVHDLLLPVISLLVAQHGHCLAHAAAFLDDDGAVLVLGASGQGKSSLIAAALGGGHDVLSDDLVVLRHDSGGLLVAGVPQPLALPADLGHDAAVGELIDGDHRSRRAPAGAVLLDPGWHRLVSVILVEHSGEPDGHLRAAPGMEVLHRLLTSTLDGIHATTSQLAFPFAAAVARAPGWHLGHAKNPAARSASVAKKLAEIRAVRARDG